jgi:tRNA/rRNA methyltransferase
VRIGLLFGNERTGLTSEELKHSNFRFKIPQKQNQPSYNLSAAVLLTLFRLFTKKATESFMTEEIPVSRKEQDECIRLILDKLKVKGFIHNTNKQHMTEIAHNLFGKCAMTEKDRRFLLALFSKGLL